MFNVFGSVRVEMNFAIAGNTCIELHYLKFADLAKANNFGIIWPLL